MGEPLLDSAIIADLYYHSPRQADYEGFRFSLNYRLSREKDFEFVGVEGARLWSTKGLPAIGTKRVKASEMAQMLSYLTEIHDDTLDPDLLNQITETGEMSRWLTFFEWNHGILPFDAAMAALLPDPMLPEQRSAVLRFESPQHYTSYLVEVRYPTGNRGGWLQGLDSFFQEYLIAGAMITLARTEEPNVFTIAYEEAGASDTERLLTLDEKKNKFTFADMVYECAVDEELVLRQSRFGKLKNLKSLPNSERRRADVVLRHVFDVAGDRVGTRQQPEYQMLLDDLYVAYNVLRPASIGFLRSLLEGDEQCFSDPSLPDMYTYIPVIEEVEQETVEEIELEEDELMIRWSKYNQYEDE
ncbi:MAG: hypothetical protein HC837_18915 [Chloroflexaceae bacterium]|nr:hypothetical protein [Chloroflexaceae bacterium]